MVMHFQTLCARLRKGVHPIDLPRAKYLDEGSSRVAYTVGRYVVKEHLPPQDESRKMLHELPEGVIFCREWIVNGWVIQPRYKTLTYDQWQKRDPLFLNTLYESWLDLGPHNVGLDTRGRVVAFDW